LLRSLQATAVIVLMVAVINNILIIASEV